MSPNSFLYTYVVVAAAPTSYLLRPSSSPVAARLARHDVRVVLALQHVQHLREAKVADLAVPRRVHEEVVGLQVAVHDLRRLVLVEIPQPLRAVQREPPRDGLRQQAPTSLLCAASGVE